MESKLIAKIFRQVFIDKNVSGTAESVEDVADFQGVRFTEGPASA